MRGIFDRFRRPRPRARRSSHNVNANGRLVIPMTGRSDPLILSFGDFQAVNQIPGSRSVLAQHVVPRKALQVLNQVQPFRLQLFSHYRAEDVSLNNGDYVADLSDADITIVEAGRGGDAASVRAYVNGVRVPQGDITVDYDENEVTIDGESVSAGDDVDIYALEGKGDVRIVAAQPAGVDLRAVEIYNSSLAALHETDQADSKTAPRLFHGRVEDIPLASKMQLRLEVNTPATIAWTADARHVLSFRGRALPADIVDQVTLNRVVAALLK